MRFSGLVALGLAGSAVAFSPGPSLSKVSAPLSVPTSPAVPRSGTVALRADAAADPDAKEKINLTEKQREKWRTVHTYDDWVKFRSPNRFFTILGNIRYSGILRMLLKEVSVITAIATAVVAWNVFLVEGYTDLAGVQHQALVDASLPAIGLPLTAFTVTSPSLGLLLVFRTNSSYRRWDEARKNWGLNINRSRDLMRKATAWCSAEYEPDAEVRKEKLRRLSKATWSFMRSLQRHLSDPETEDEFQRELYEKLPKENADAIIAAAHRPNRAMFDIGVAINDLPMHFIRRNEIDQDVVVFEDTCGSNERLFTSPIPIFYTRHTARFLSAWMLLLPLGLYDPFKATWNHIGMIPAAAVIAIFLFGIEELAVQLEEPFSVLPMQGFSDKIGRWCDEISEWHEAMPVPENPASYYNPPPPPPPPAQMSAPPPPPPPPVAQQQYEPAPAAQAQAQAQEQQEVMAIDEESPPAPRRRFSPFPSRI